MKQETAQDYSAGQGRRSFGSDRGAAAPSSSRAGQSNQGFPSQSQSQQWSQGDSNSRGFHAKATEWKGSDQRQPHVGGDARRGNMGGAGGGWAAPKPAVRATVRCSNVPADVGPVELSQHFAAFGSVVDMRLRAVTAENGSKGQKEALVQFASANQAQACVSVSNYASRFHLPRVSPLVFRALLSFFGSFLFSNLQLRTLIGLRRHCCVAHVDIMVLLSPVPAVLLVYSADNVDIQEVRHFYCQQRMPFLVGVVLLETLFGPRGEHFNKT